MKRSEKKKPERKSERGTPLSEGVKRPDGGCVWAASLGGPAARQSGPVCPGALKVSQQMSRQLSQGGGVSVAL